MLVVKDVIAQLLVPAAMGSLPHAVTLIRHEGLLHSRTERQYKSFSIRCLEHGIYHSNRRVAQHSSTTLYQ